jgi:DNA-binding NtrC family response regulator
MLVDDEERFLQTTNKLLAKKGYEAVTATSGAEALDKLEVSIIDVVILDVKMPGMDGVETLKQIKSRFPLVEVIMLTGHGTINSAVDGMKTGAFDYLTKPCDLDELLAKALDAHENKKKMEEKIRMAQTRTYMKSPREILKSDDKNE